MPSLIDIRRRIRAVKNTQQITKAMKMVSAAKLRRAQERVVGARPYAQQMLQRPATAWPPRVDPIGAPAAGGAPGVRRTHAADRHHRRQGAVRRFNTNVDQGRQRSFANETPARQVAMGLVGRKGRDFFRRRGFDVRYEDVGLFSALKLVARAGDRRPRHRGVHRRPRVDAVYLVYNEFKSVMHAARRRRAAAADRALTSGRRRRAGRSVDYLFEPSPEAILERAAAALRRDPDLPRAARVGGRRARRAHDGDGRGDAQRERHDRQADAVHEQACARRRSRRKSSKSCRARRRCRTEDTAHGSGDRNQHEHRHSRPGHRPRRRRRVRGRTAAGDLQRAAHPGRDDVDGRRADRHHRAKSSSTSARTACAPSRCSPPTAWCAA